MVAIGETLLAILMFENESVRIVNKLLRYAHSRHPEKSLLRVF